VEFQKPLYPFHQMLKVPQNYSVKDIRSNKLIWNHILEGPKRVRDRLHSVLVQTFGVRFVNPCSIVFSFAQGILLEVAEFLLRTFAHRTSRGINPMYC